MTEKPEQVQQSSQEAKETQPPIYLEIRAQTAQEELDYILGELIPRFYQYKAYGYEPAIPQLPPFTNAIKDGIEKVGRNILTLNFLQHGGYKKNHYEKGVELLNSKIPEIWEQCVAVMQELNNLWEFELYSNYEVRLTAYGTGGDYYPSFSAFDGEARPQPGLTTPGNGNAIILMKVNEDGEFKRPNPKQTPIHEIVHLGIENVIVRKYKLEHWEKERVIDLICKIKFGDLLPNYVPQNYRDEDRGLDKFITAETIDNLPEAIERYIKANPRSES